MSLGRVSRAALLLLLCAASAGAASLLDPRFGFRTLTTEHFVVYFHQGEEAQARRLCALAEEAWHLVSATLSHPAPRRTHVILADQADLANGWATPLPRNTVFITTAAPGGAEFIGRSTDWLRLVFTHELTHIAHLDRSEGWTRIFRGILGRTPIAFPNLFLPAWQIEGLATWQESRLTGEGRLHAGNFQMIEREAARTRKLEPLDRVNGGLTDWPNGFAAYAYGAGFHQYLADRFGADTLGRLADETARSLPFLGTREFRTVYGEPLGTLWADYRASLATGAAAGLPASAPADGTTTVRRLTHHGHVVIGPRFTPSCDGCADQILYSVRNPDGFPTLRSLPLDGSGSERLADRYLGSTTGIGTNVIVFDQQEWRRNVGLYSDLYLIDRHTRRQQQLTHESRIQDPDLSPDGRTIVGVRERRGRRELVLLPLHTGTGGDVAATASMPDVPERTTDAGRWMVGATTVLASDPEEQFNTPRWSPDGRSIAVARQRLGVLSEIVVFDPAGGAGRTIASAPSTRIVTPAWRPDGGAVVAAADHDGGPFDLYEFQADGSTPAGRRLTELPGGATWPDISRDGRAIVFVGYTVDGFDLFTVAYPPPVRTGTTATTDSVQQPVVPDSAHVADKTLSAQPYSPLSTLAPTSWSPILETGSNQLRAGIAIAAADVLTRHSYTISATWLVTGPRGEAAPPAVAPDWRVVYAYDRWRPTVFARAVRDTAFGVGPPDEAGRSTNLTRQSTELETGVLYPVYHARVTHHAVASVVRTTDRDRFADHQESRDRNAVRLGWSSSTARTFGYSISQEHGVSIGGTAEFAAGAGHSPTSATTLTVDVRGYLAALAPHHVVALRAAAGWSEGDRNGERIFHLGGAYAGRDPIDFGYQAISLLRGFAPDTFAGSRAAVVNGDYRFPLARPQRGRGTVPLFLRNVHAAVFADAGHAWTERFSIDDVKLSAGGELVFDVVAGYSAPVTIGVGAAWGRDGAGAGSGGALYARVGRAF